MAERLCSKCVHNNCCFISQGYGAGTIHTDLDAMDCDDYHEKQEWISVEERLPEDFVSVIGYLPINSREGFPPTREVYHTERGWYVPTLGGLCIVTHWRPLPEPPKEDAHG